MAFILHVLRSFNQLSRIITSECVLIWCCRLFLLIFAWNWLDGSEIHQWHGQSTSILKEAMKLTFLKCVQSGQSVEEGEGDRERAASINPWHATSIHTL